jgi:hypothetical protein
MPEGVKSWKMAAIAPPGELPAKNGLVELPAGGRIGCRGLKMRHTRQATHSFFFGHHTYSANKSDRFQSKPVGFLFTFFSVALWLTFLRGNRFFLPPSQSELYKKLFSAFSVVNMFYV